MSTLFAQVCLSKYLAHLTVDQEVTGSIPATSSNILSWRLVMKYFLWSSLSSAEGQLSVSGERMCTSTGQLLRGLCLLGKCG